MDDHRTRSDSGVIANANSSEYLRAGSDDDVVSNRRVTFSALVTGSAQRYVLVDQDIVADLGGFADDDAHAVIDKETATDDGTGVDFDAGEKTGNLRDHARQQRHFRQVE